MHKVSLSTWLLVAVLVPIAVPMAVAKLAIRWIGARDWAVLLLIVSTVVAAIY